MTGRQFQRWGVLDPRGRRSLQPTVSEQSLFHIETMKNEPLATAMWRYWPPPQGGHPEKAPRIVFAPDRNDQPAIPIPIGLSPRERQVMEHLAQGLLYKEIADCMAISYAAVHKHQHKIF